ncbi:MAG: 30S ribosomal protein S27e [Candidatus Aenigmatarchaeota archaeon]
MGSPKSKFLKVKCKKCRNEQIIFNKAAIVVKCLVCESILAEPTGGLAEIKTKIEEVMD